MTRATASPADRGPSLADAHAAIDTLGRLAELFQHRRQQLAQGAGLTELEWGVLEEISTEHFMPSLFARRRESSPAAVSKILRQLAGKGLISVSVSKDDGRHRNYVPTPKGRRVLGRLRRSREHAIHEVWLRFEAEPMRSFTEFGRQLIERLEEYARQADSRPRSVGKERQHGQDAL